MNDFELSSHTQKEGGISSLDAHYSLCWCPSRYFPPCIVASSGKDYNARIYTCDDHNKWVVLETLLGHSDLVTDVSWAPNLGRSYELIATACRDGHVRLFKLKEASMDSKKRYKVDCIGDFGDHEAAVWRVSWNLSVFDFILN